MQDTADAETAMHRHCIGKQLICSTTQLDLCDAPELHSLLLLHILYSLKKDAANPERGQADRYRAQPSPFLWWREVSKRHPPLLVTVSRTFRGEGGGLSQGCSQPPTN